MYESKPGIFITTVQKRTTPLVRDLRYPQMLSPPGHNQPKLTCQMREHTPNSINLTLSPFPDQKPTHRQRQSPTKLKRESLQALLTSMNVPAIVSSRLAQSLCRVFNVPNERNKWVRAGDIVKLLEAITESKQSSLRVMREVVERVGKGTEVMSHLALNSHISELYQIATQMREPDLGFVIYKFRAYVKQHQKGRSLTPNKSEQLFEESKLRQKRKRQRQYDRILKEVAEQNQQKQTYQELLKKHQPSQQRKTPVKKPQPPKQKTYSYNKANPPTVVRSQPKRILFELNVRVDGQMCNVEIYEGDQPKHVVSRLQANLPNVSPSIASQLLLMVNQYMSQHVHSQ